MEKIGNMKLPCRFNEAVTGAAGAERYGCGQQRRKRVDLRIIAATNKNLRRDREGRFARLVLRLGNPLQCRLERTREESSIADISRSVVSHGKAY